MNSYNRDCDTCRRIDPNGTYRVQIESEIFYKGFFIKIIYSKPNPTDPNPSKIERIHYLCIRFAEGGDYESVDDFLSYLDRRTWPISIGTFDPSGCLSHPHEACFGAGSVNKKIWTLGENTAKDFIDTLFGDQDEMQNMQQE